MLCEKCNKNNATSIITNTINGKTTTVNLCAECAFKVGYSNIFGEFSLNHIIPDLERAMDFEVHCSKCNSTFGEILSNGKLGCSECYSIFKNELIPAIEDIHGKAYHVGKRPNKYQQNENIEDIILQLKQKIEQAIKTEDFEQAAIMRDKIKELEDN